MNISFCLTKPYGNFPLLGRYKNKPNLRKAKMKLSLVMTKYYENEPHLSPPAKQSQNKPNSNPAAE